MAVFNTRERMSPNIISISKYWMSEIKSVVNFHHVRGLSRDAINSAKHIQLNAVKSGQMT